MGTKALQLALDWIRKTAPAALVVHAPVAAVKRALESLKFAMVGVRADDEGKPLVLFMKTPSHPAGESDAESSKAEAAADGASTSQLSATQHARKQQVDPSKMTMKEKVAFLLSAARKS